MFIKTAITMLLLFPLMGCTDATEHPDPENNNACRVTDNEILVKDPAYSPESQSALLDEVARNYFMYFWDDCHPRSKMARIGTDRAVGTVALAGSAYAVTTLPVAVERGWITRPQAAQRLVQICRFLNTAERYHGAWSHWINGNTGAGLPFNANQQSAGDLVETAFMMMGLLVCSEYFNGSGALETEARGLINDFWNTIDWNFYTNNQNQLFWAWDKNMGFAPLKITGPNEALPAYVLALAAPAGHAISKAVFENGWRGGRNYYNEGRHTYGYRFELGKEPEGGPLFTTQHPFLWFNPYQLSDEYADYWEVCCHHALINRHYCLYEAPEAYGYNETNWGLSACYGPAPKNYQGRSPSKDDGVIATTASIGAISVTPFYALQTFGSMQHNPALNGTYGVIDAYSSIDNWNDDRYLSISIMPIVSIIENYRTGLIWQLAMRNEKIRNGLDIIGMQLPVYNDGFCQMPVNTVDQTAELTACPDTGKYALRYSWRNTADQVSISLFPDTESGTSCSFPVQPVAGVNTLEIGYDRLPGGDYTARLYADDQLIDTLKIRVR